MMLRAWDDVAAVLTQHQMLSLACPARPLAYYPVDSPCPDSEVFKLVCDLCRRNMQEHISSGNLKEVSKIDSMPFHRPILDNEPSSTVIIPHAVRSCDLRQAEMQAVDHARYSAPGALY
jgi:hypothetical protein